MVKFKSGCQRVINKNTLMRMSVAAGGIFS